MVPKLDLTLPCLFSFLADVKCWMLMLEKQVYEICEKCLQGMSKPFSVQPLSKCQEQGTFFFLLTK